MRGDLACDVLCIGAGGAGLAAAVTTARMGARVLVVSKMPYGCGNTWIAGGLVLRPDISPKDSLDSVMRDIIVGGEFLNDQPLVGQYCRHAHLATEVMETFGLLFSRTASGRPAPLPTALGGHSLPRTFSATQTVHPKHLWSRRRTGGSSVASSATAAFRVAQNSTGKMTPSADHMFS